ncbi:MAG: Flp family type IVb pilin [Pseudomonas sp.]|jgi:pilus assembly protein Flp/PilA|nr:Flp family type IVb pilin [Pseudomonas sp.]
MMEKIIQLQLKAESFLKREDGASAIEYAIIAGLIAVVIIGAATLLGEQISIVFEKITAALS